MHTNFFKSFFKVKSKKSFLLASHGGAALFSLLFSFCFCFIMTYFSIFSAQAGPFDWKIKKPAWSEQDESNFQEFVRQFAVAVKNRQCNKVADCFKSSANIYYKSDPPGLRYYSDCADFPYYLRAYFAWKNGLPFSYTSQVSPRANEERSKDIRYTKSGNRVLSKKSIVTSSAKKFPNALEILNKEMNDTISSSMMRTFYKDQDSTLFSDFYPLKISRETLNPGSIIYDVDGHVAVLVNILDDGRVEFMDAHPDGSISFKEYGVEFERSRPEQGGGFKAFRPLKLINYEKDNEGNLISGQIVALKNEELNSFGLSQYYGTKPDPQGSWSKGLFVFDNETVNYFQWVRMSLAVGHLTLRPLEELSNRIKNICTSLEDRVNAVAESINQKMDKKAHPPQLPENIYGTSGEWEIYSTPSRDARLKVSYIDLVDESRSMIDRYLKGDRRIEYSGNNLPLDLLETYEKESQACQITYTNSLGRPVVLNLEDLRRRLFKISFDPYHCVELRWGAGTEAIEQTNQSGEGEGARGNSISEELSSCRMEASKFTWYEREQFLRNQHLRKYEDKMNFSLEELKTWKAGNGRKEPMNVDLVGYLKSLISTN